MQYAHSTLNHNDFRQTGSGEFNPLQTSKDWLRQGHICKTKCDVMYIMQFDSFIQHSHSDLLGQVKPVRTGFGNWF